MWISFVNLFSYLKIKSICSFAVGFEFGINFLNKKVLYDNFLLEIIDGSNWRKNKILPRSVCVSLSDNLIHKIVKIKKKRDINCLPENVEDKNIRTLLLFFGGIFSKFPFMIVINLCSSIFFLEHFC